MVVELCRYNYVEYRDRLMLKVRDSEVQYRSHEFNRNVWVDELIALLHQYSSDVHIWKLRDQWFSLVGIVTDIKIECVVDQIIISGNITPMVNDNDIELSKIRLQVVTDNDDIVPYLIHRVYELCDSHVDFVVDGDS